jgi:hypothetical protein
MLLLSANKLASLRHMSAEQGRPRHVVCEDDILGTVTKDLFVGLSCASARSYLAGQAIS